MFGRVGMQHLQLTHSYVSVKHIVEKDPTSALSLRVRNPQRRVRSCYWNYLFIVEHKDKVAKISSIAVLIRSVIHLLLFRKITLTHSCHCRQCLYGLQSVLSSTHEHMTIWKERMSPGTHQPVGSN